MQQPLAIIGAGPIGLAAAAHAATRGLPYVVLEAGPVAGAAVAAWSHVRLFSAWRELVDPAAERLLAATGWVAPDPDDLPDRRRVARGLPRAAGRRCSTPAPRGRSATTPASPVSPAPAATCSSTPVVTSDPFAVHVETPAGAERLLARAVVDASGTWTTPNPLGADGYPALGEREHADRISYGIPDLADPAVAARYAGKHVAVAGKGASAQGVLIGLAEIARARPGHPGVVAAATAQRRGRLRWRRQRPARAARRARPAGQGGGLERGGRPTSPRFRTVAVEPQARRPADPGLRRRPAGRRRRRGRGGDRVPPRPVLPVRGAPRPRPGAAGLAGARRADPPRPPQLRRRRAARSPRARPSPRRASTSSG